MKLIENHFDSSIKQPMPKFIAGPTTLTVHKSPDEKRMIYIFGEWHTGIKDCTMFHYEEDEKWNNDNPDKMTIDYFLYELMKTTSAYLDIYFEFPAFPKENYGYYKHFSYAEINDHLHNLFGKFKKCVNKLNSSRSIGECSLARIHYFDSRRINRGRYLFGLTDITYLVETVDILKIQYGENFNKRLVNEYLKLVKTDKVIEILNALGSSSEQEFKDFWIEQLNDNELNIKETKSGKYQNRATIEEITIMKSIKDFMEKEIVRNAMKYRDLYIRLVNIIFKESKIGGRVKTFYSVFEILIEYVINTASTIADVYLLARVFKDFDMTKMKTHSNRYITDQPNRAYNVIIYAGDLHSQVYRRYLKEVAGFEEIASTGTNNNGQKVNCIDMRTIPQPFFSTWTQTWTDLWAKYIAEQSSKPI